MLLCIKNLIYSKYIWLLALLALGWRTGAQAQDTAALWKEARQLDAAFKDEAALAKYLELERYQPANPVLLCRISELYSVAGNNQPARDKQKEYYRKGRDYAQKALQASPRYADAHVSMAIAMGRMALISSGKEKINAVKDIKTYAEKAIQLDPANFKAYHVLGKWHYEVSDLSSVEKWLVKTAFGALPAASLQEAIRNYEKCRQLNPLFVLNYLELGKAYHRQEEDAKARNMLHTVIKLPPTNSNDAGIKKEAKTLLDKWK